MIKIIITTAFIVSTAMMLNAQTQTVILQQGLNSYTGCEDKELRDPRKNYFNGPDEQILVLSEL